MTTKTIESPRKSQVGTLSSRAARALMLINPLIIVFVVIYIALGLYSERFWTELNQMNITRQIAVYMVIALGQTFVITSGGIDLSVGSALGVTSCALGILVKNEGVPLGVAVPITILLGALIGLVNGLIITKLNVPPLIATLGMLVTLRGGVHLYMAGDVLVRLPSSLVYIGQGVVAGIPVPAIISLVLVLVAWWLFNHTRFGRYVSAVGSNEPASRLVGLHVDRIKVLAYVLQGALVGVAAAIIVGRLNAASPEIGLNYELHVIAAVVLGGTSLFGGRGTIVGTAFGIMTLGVLENGMVLIGANFHMQRVLIGMLLILAVAYQGWRHTRRGTLER